MNFKSPAQPRCAVLEKLGETYSTVEVVGELVVKHEGQMLDDIPQNPEPADSSSHTRLQQILRGSTFSLQACLWRGRRSAGLGVDVRVRGLRDDGDAATWESGGECCGDQGGGELGARCGARSLT